MKASAIVFIFLVINTLSLNSQNNMNLYNEGMKFYLEGDYKNAFIAFNNGVQAGDRDMCAFQLGECYFEGIGCNQDFQRAFELHLESASHGNDFAAYALGMDYYYGYGCKKDNKEALKWYKIAHESGFIPEATNNFASMLANGEGCQKNIKAAFNLFVMAADQGVCAAQYTLGMCYYEGSYNSEDVGIKKNDNLSRYYLELAAKQGHKMAAIKLDVLFER